MTYRERQRLADIQAAIDAIHAHLQRGDLSDGLVFDAVRIRLLEIGEAVKALPAEMLSTQPAIPWSQIARMRDHLAHRYFDTDHAILQAAWKFISMFRGETTSQIVVPSCDPPAKVGDLRLVKLEGIPSCQQQTVAFEDGQAI